MIWRRSTRWWAVRHPYVITQSHGQGSPIDGIACTEVLGGGAWRPPQSFISLRPNGRTPDATEGFAALYTPAVQEVRQRALSLPDDPEPEPEVEDEDAAPKKKKGSKKQEEEEGEEGDVPPPPPPALPPCLWLVGGVRPDGLMATLDFYDLEEERWMGDPLEFEPGSLAPPPMAHAAAAAVPRPDGKSHMLWVFGGRTQNGLSAEMWTFDVKGLTWYQVSADGMPPEPREQHSLTRVLTRFLFAFGGLNSDGAPMLDVAIFGRNSGRCCSLSCPPQDRPRGGVRGGSLYIFGGADGEEAQLAAAPVRLRQALPADRGARVRRRDADNA